MSLRTIRMPRAEQELSSAQVQGSQEGGLHPAADVPEVKVSPRWLAPTMVVSWIIGILWIAIYYVAPNAPFIGHLQNWNLLIGFVFIIFGVVFSTRWR